MFIPSLPPPRQGPYSYSLILEMPDSCSPLLRDWPTLLCRCQGPQMSAGNYRSCRRSRDFPAWGGAAGRPHPPYPLLEAGVVDGRNKGPSPPWPAPPEALILPGPPSAALAPSFLPTLPCLHPGLPPWTTVWMPISTRPPSPFPSGASSFTSVSLQSLQSSCPQDAAHKSIETALRRDSPYPRRQGSHFLRPPSSPGAEMDTQSRHSHTLLTLSLTTAPTETNREGHRVTIELQVAAIAASLASGKGSCHPAGQEGRGVRREALCQTCTLMWTLTEGDREI